MSGCGVAYCLTESNMSDEEVTLDEFKALVNNKGVLVIDVRELSELEKTGVIPGSINIPLASLESTLKDKTNEEFKALYNKEKPRLGTPLVFSCYSGRRSKAALDLTTQLGYLKVKHYPGGWSGWEQGLTTD